MIHRECLRRLLASQVTDWVPNYALGWWGQTVQRWLGEGINCFWPLEQAAGTDPVRLRKKFGNDVVLAGGLDKIALAKGRQAIDRELHAKIPPLLEAGGYIPHIDHAISPELSYPDFLYYLDLKRKLTGRDGL